MKTDSSYKVAIVVPCSFSLPSSSNLLHTPILPQNLFLAASSMSRLSQPMDSKSLRAMNGVLCSPLPSSIWRFRELDWCRDVLAKTHQVLPSCDSSSKGIPSYCDIFFGGLSGSSTMLGKLCSKNVFSHPSLVKSLVCFVFLQTML